MPNTTSNKFIRNKFDTITKICFNNKMINVFRHPNFANWFNVVFNGELIDGARTHAQALEIAKKLSVKYSSPILSSK
jgi:hypothetical protein